MQNIDLTLAAGVPKFVPVAGKVLVVQSADQGDGLTITFASGNAISSKVMQIGPGARIEPAGGFSGVTIEASEAGRVLMIATNGDIDVQITKQSAVVANGDDQALPVRTPPGTRLAVDIVGGSVNVTASDVTTTQKQGDAISENAPVVVALAAGLLIAAGERRALRVRNAGDGLLAIGGNQALTVGQAALVLNPGDVWEETLAPQLAWYAVSDAGTVAAVEVVA